MLLVPGCLLGQAGPYYYDHITVDPAGIPNGCTQWSLSAPAISDGYPGYIVRPPDTSIATLTLSGTCTDVYNNTTMINGGTMSVQYQNQSSVGMYTASSGTLYINDGLAFNAVVVPTGLNSGAAVHISIQTALPPYAVQAPCENAVPYAGKPFSVNCGMGFFRPGTNADGSHQFSVDVEFDAGTFSVIMHIFYSDTGGGGPPPPPPPSGNGCPGGSTGTATLAPSVVFPKPAVTGVGATIALTGLNSNSVSAVQFGTLPPAKVMNVTCSEVDIFQSVPPNTPLGRYEAVVTDSSGSTHTGAYLYVSGIEMFDPNPALLTGSDASSAGAILDPKIIAAKIASLPRRLAVSADGVTQVLIRILGQASGSHRGLPECRRRPPVD